MSVRSSLLVALCLSLAPSACVQAQSDGISTTARGSRTVVHHPRDLITLHAKLHYTTLIVLPDGEDVVEATCGDKEFWIVNARDHLVSVKPAKPAAETNLNLITASGQVYAFLLTEVSEMKGQEPDLTVYVEPEDGPGVAVDRLKYVPIQQIEDFRAQAEFAREDARRATDAARVALDSGLTEFRATYPVSLRFPYRFAADQAPFFVHAIFHDDRRTFIQAHASELPSLYEWQDGAPNLVNFAVRDGTYIVPKVLQSGYLQLGKRRLFFGTARQEYR
jgi:type IV secretion system protein VirB9